MNLPCKAQLFGNPYKWKYVGPRVTPSSNLDSGSWTATGVGWIESMHIGKDYMLAGSITGGLYKTTNAGNSWEKIDKDTLQMGSPSLLVKNGVIYRTTGLTHFDQKIGLGLLKSQDEGSTWTSAGLEFTATDEKPLWVVNSAVGSEYLLACTPNQIFRSNINDERWTKTFETKEVNFRSLVFTTQKDQVFATGSFLYVSKDDGSSWKNITERLTAWDEGVKYDKQRRFALCEDPNQAGRLLCSYTFRNQLYIDESIDYGKNWKLLNKSSRVRRADIHHNEIAVAKGNSRHIYVGAVRLFRSTDNGATFVQVTRPVVGHHQFAHDDIRELNVIDTLTTFIATDGGIFKTIDGGATWANLSGRNLNVQQIYGLGLLSKDRIAYGCQDMGTFLKTDKWMSIGRLYGDGGDVLNYNGDAMVLVNGQIQRFDFLKMSPKYIHPRTKQSPFISKLHAYPGSKDSIYFIVDDAFLFDGKKWVNKTKSLDAGGFRANGFHISQENPSVMFFAYDQPTWDPRNMKNKFFKSSNGGATWRDITENLPILAWRSINYITSNPTNQNEVYVCFAINGTKKKVHRVYRSLDGGETWENFSAGLPQLEAFKIMFIEGSNSGVLVSTLQGMFYRNSEMSAWLKLDGPIPSIAIRDFEIDYENRFVYAGTYGNGLWRMKLKRKMRIR